jgi:hypothetical protein
LLQGQGLDLGGGGACEGAAAAVEEQPGGHGRFTCLVALGQPVEAEQFVRAGEPGGSGGSQSWRLRPLFAFGALATPDVVCGVSEKLTFFSAQNSSGRSCTSALLCGRTACSGCRR